jgi:hypothetical protein
MNNSFARIGLSTALGVGLVAGVGVGTAVPAQAKTVVACVKKSHRSNRASRSNGCAGAVADG